jgi:hypothetical protein
MTEVKENDTGGITYVSFIADTAEELVSSVEAYLRDYPYAGYMTHEMDNGQTLSGKVYANFWRRSSCD